MAYITDELQKTGFYIPTTSAIDVTQIYDTEVNSSEFKELIVKLYQNFNNMAIAINNKPSGYKLDSEFMNGNLYFSPTSASVDSLRPSMSKVINFGALPDNSTKSVAHGITVTATTYFVRKDVMANDNVGSSFIPIPYASNTPADVIELYVDATSVNITTASNKTAYTTCYVYLEWLTF